MIRQKIELLNSLIKEKYDIEKVFIPWVRQYNQTVATEPQCKTETIRKSVIENINNYPSDMRPRWDRLQEIAMEIEILMNEIELLKIEMEIDHD